MASATERTGSQLRHRVLLTTFRYPPFGDGAEKQAQVLATALARRGAHVTVLTSRFGKFPTLSQDDGVEIRRLPYLARLPVVGGAPRAVLLYLSIASFLIANRQRYDLVHSNLGGMFSAVAIAAAKVAGLPSILRFAGTGTADFDAMKRAPRYTLSPVLARLLTKADRIVVLNKSSIAAVARIVEPARIRYIPNGVEAPSVFWDARELGERRRQLNLPSDTEYLFAAGRLHPDKGYDLLIEAAPALGGIPVVIAGEGPERERLDALARASGVALRLLGKKSRDEVVQWMLGASVVAAPSYAEGMSNTVLEALSLGCPVVTSDVPGNVELVQHNKTGFLHRSGDITSMVTVSRMLLDSRSLASALGCRAREETIRNFSVEMMRERYESVYDEVTHGRVG